MESRESLINFKKDKKNCIVKSSLYQYSSQSIEKDYSLKYVSSGTELYSIDGKSNILKENFALIVNPNQSLEVKIKSKQPVKGFCCFIDKSIITQVINTQEKSTYKLLDDHTVGFDLNYFLNFPIHINGTLLSSAISRIKNMEKYEFFDYSLEDLFFLIAENMGFHYSYLKKNIHNLKCNKLSTRKELYKRIQTGRSFINDNLQNPNLKLRNIASASCLSEYHFH